MSSLLTFQLRQQQQKSGESQSGLPSPPNSFCGDESSQSNNIVVERRNSLQTVFNDMTIKDYSTSLPENYTIDHSTIKRNTPIAIATATAAATGGLTIRNRRQSEANIIGGRRKSRGLSESFNGQYRCNDCGKSYKHPNCLQKHRWEHSEEWEVTKKLSLTKHQQVQMLEAAAILVGMDRRIEENFVVENHHFDENEESSKSIIEIKIEQDHRLDEHIDEEENESIIIDDDDLDRLSTMSDSSSIFMEDL
ncbi:hypothetical protein BDF21DRAFT_414644 [Thamnidium elegans]|uniref:C2H2-type domain-containing protein n=1 Tax=Thamnidium elegans TaxID=101142 RepID=A0A8H7SQD5_9FUNG|nr:hypothetical protein INT48_000326 [Thamnidium elegans]KAI8087543.1 hypothetical protein BDF21DRAFT_414644 [Thamnidium elegans]